MEDKEKKYSVYVDIENIKLKKQQIDEKYNELVEMFKNYQKMIENTKEVYDTESAKYFRTIASEYMKIALIYLNNDFKICADKLNDVIKIYSETNESINKMVNKGDSVL